MPPCFIKWGDSPPKPPACSGAGTGSPGFWAGPGGGREVLEIAYPLILSNLSFTLQTFINRLFLTWYSAEAMAAAVTGLFTTWAILGLFIGTGEYLTTFIAQYHGAGRPSRIGPALWQGIYFSLLAGVLVLALSPFVGLVFDLAGHGPELRIPETAYARILMQGAFPIVLLATLSSFFAGRGRTKVVLLVNVIATALNAVLDYLWIFGLGGFPRAGVVGAAWATVVSQAFGAVLLLALIFSPGNRAAYGTLSGWRLEPKLFGRLLRFGLPSGAQFSLEVLGFAIFLMLVGRIGTGPLAASGIAFNLNMIVFMPMVGLSMGVSAVVGRHLGAQRPDLAERSTWTALRMSLVYMSACGALYVLAPRLLLAPYAAGSDPATFAGIAATATVLLRFVTVYSFFDMLNVIFAGALKGAGDTLYPLVATVALSWSAMIVPAYLACVVFGAGVYVAWCTASAYIILVGLLLMRRFQAGSWKALRVIEPQPPDLETGGTG